MSGKLKENDDLAAKIQESANQIWLAGLGAFAKAQEEGGKIFEALVQEGELVQQRTKEAASERVAEFRENVAGTWDKIEHVFEQRVARALHTLNVPTKKDIDQLSKRIAELTAVANKLSAGSVSPRRAARR